MVGETIQRLFEFGPGADASESDTRRSVMSPNQLKNLYSDLQRSFNARPSDLKSCSTLLTQLKARSSHTFFPGQGSPC